MNIECKKTILLVEDEAIIGMMEKRSLEKYGYKVHHVTNGRKAIEIVSDNETNVDLILMDIDLGSAIDGIQVATEILAKKDLPVIFLSSHTEPEVVTKTENITSYGYVVKNSDIVVLDASIKMAIKLFEEKTERKRAMEQISFQANIIDNSPIIAAYHDRNLNTLWVNKAYQDATGLSLEEVKGKKCYNVWKLSTSCRNCPVIMSIESGEKASYELTPDNQDNWPETQGSWLSMATPVRDERGDVIGALEFAINITERKRVEKEILKQLAEKEILLREIHHRTKNNLANIEGLLSLQASSASNPEVNTQLQDAISRVQSMRILYDNLLISKDCVDVSIKSYTESLIDSLITVFVLKGNISIEKNILEFNLSSKQAFFVGIIINELLTNVFKYAFVSCDKRNVSISVDKKENTVTIIIQDNGIGIDDRIIKNKSTGFGLTIVKMLVEQLNGTYNVVNDNGAKSVIQFEL